MIHQDDCIRIIAQVLNKNVWNETFNACADMHPNRQDFYTKAALDNGLDIPEFDAQTSVQDKIINNKKLKS